MPVQSPRSSGICSESVGRRLASSRSRRSGKNDGKLQSTRRAQGRKAREGVLALTAVRDQLRQDRQARQGVLGPPTGLTRSGHRPGRPRLPGGRRIRTQMKSRTPGFSLRSGCGDPGGFAAGRCRRLQEARRVFLASWRLGVLANPTVRVESPWRPGESDRSRREPSTSWRIRPYASRVPGVWANATVRGGSRCGPSAHSSIRSSGRETSVPARLSRIAPDAAEVPETPLHLGRDTSRVAKPPINRARDEARVAKIAW